MTSQPKPNLAPTMPDFEQLPVDVATGKQDLQVQPPHPNHPDPFADTTPLRELTEEQWAAEGFRRTATAWVRSIATLGCSLAFNSSDELMLDGVRWDDLVDHWVGSEVSLTRATTLGRLRHLVAALE